MIISNKYIILLISLLYNICLHGQSDNLILWNADSVLSWSDFIAIPNKSSPNSAMSAVAIQTSKFIWVNNTMKGDVCAYFSRDSSWYNVEDIKLLNHEQGHFDIAEIYARRLRRALTSKRMKKNEFSITFDKIVNQFRRESDFYQDKYDSETEHHLNENAQNKWDAMIKNQLFQLDKYSTPHVVIRLK